MRFLALLLLVACASAPPALPEPLRAAATAERVDTLLEAPSLQSVLSDFLPRTEGFIRAVHGPTACQPAGGVNAYVVLPDRMPVEGQPLRLKFVTRHGGNAPSAPCWLVLSFREFTPLDFSTFGMPGCWLLVAPDSIVAVPTVTGGSLWRDGGDVHFVWTPPSAGTHFWLQMIVAAPGETPGGFIASHAVEVIVGSP